MALPTTTDTQRASIHQSVQKPTACLASMRSTYLNMPTTCLEELLLQEQPRLPATRSLCIGGSSHHLTACHSPHQLKAWCHLCIGGSCWGAAVAQQDSPEQVMLRTVLSTNLHTGTQSRPGNTHSTPDVVTGARQGRAESQRFARLNPRHRCCCQVLLPPRVTTINTCGPGLLWPRRPAGTRLLSTSGNCHVQPSWQKGVEPCYQPRP